MTEKELRKLGRSELLEMLIAQSEENEQLREQVVNLQRLLDERRFIIEKAGSIAEASLSINKVFESAEAAAQDYLNNIRHLSEKQEEISERITSEAQEKAQQMVTDTERQCQLLESTTAQKCEEMKVRAKRDAENYWNAVQAKLDTYLKQQSDLRQLLTRDISDYRSFDNDSDTADI